VRAASPTRLLAYAALGLGALAPWAGSPYTARAGVIDVRALAAAVGREEDHVTALELAQWIRDRKAGLRVIDVRSAEEFDAYHLPTAENILVDALVGTSFDPTDTLVLYSEGGAHAAQAWVFLRALGYSRVFCLRGGVDDWLDDVMNPTLADDAPAQAKADFARVVELSRYFGGVPRAGVPTPPRAKATATAQARRRGC
jgi:rhodanese-related sulfurtransferase